MKKIPDDISGANEGSINLLDEELELPNISILNEEKKTIINEEKGSIEKMMRYEGESPSKFSSKPDYVSKFISALPKDELQNLNNVESSMNEVKWILNTSKDSLLLYSSKGLKHHKHHH